MKIFYLFLFSVLLLTGQVAVGQGCNLPASICHSDGSTSFSSAEGLNHPTMPVDMCFDSNNLIFISFNTLSQNYITANGITFIGEAEVNITGFSCDTSQTGIPSLAATVVSATDACIPGTYSPFIDCVPPTTEDNLTLTLDNLLPDTVYYLIINAASLDGTALSCDFNVEISGPAVQYNLEATADPATIISGETSSLSSNVGFDSYEWSGPELDQTNSQNTSVTLNDEGQEYLYTITADANGCEITEQVLVQVVPALTIRNTITPNGDGKNDTWTIGGIHRFPDAEVRVYSRWGQMVYRTRNYSPWDGDGLPEAVYYYVIDLNPLGFDTRPYTGYLTIIR